MTNAPDPVPPSPEPRPPSSLWIVFALTAVSLVLVMTIAAATMYLTWEHPGLATPITTAGSVVGGCVAIVGVIVAVARR
ncbi:hypothetical protein ACIOYT_30425 [Streptomyces halstedii]|uniref:hypothetical protein n=1 Tax=Streptomyces halstedii TaxID=1944 RepID=UPI003828FD91